MAQTHVCLRCSAFVLAILLISSQCTAQNPVQTPQRSTAASIYSLWPDWPKARPEDVQSVDSIIKAYFDVISGSAIAERDWDRFRSLFLPEGRFISLRTWNNDSHLIPDVANVQQMADRFRDNLRKTDLQERPTDIQIATSRNLTHVFITSDARIGRPPRQTSARFIDSIELIKDVDRYWIVEVTHE